MPPGRAATAVTLVLVAGTVAFGSAMVGRDPAPIPAEPSEALALPVLPLISSRFEGVALESYLEASFAYEHRDELLASPVLRDLEFTRRVHWWVAYWTGPAAAWFPGFLDRMAWLGPSVDSALATHDFPPSLRYLPLIESGYSPRVTSRASAVGLWQLMAPTARELGLEVSPLLDERSHPEKSTEAALRYLDALHSEFDSWFVALAAYNSGPTRVRGILRRHAPGEPRTDSLFWALRHHFPAETRDFLPKLYGAMWVASQPDAYGFELPVVERFAFDAVSVPDQTTLDVVALAANASHDEIVRLNPEYPRGITPLGRRVTVRVPVGQARIFAYRYSLIPPKSRVTFVDNRGPQ
jgi:membrane-bound lytic murein transglycosylase D